MSTLLVCSGGGHLKQLWTLRPRMALGETVWATFDTGQSSALLRDEGFVPVPYVAPRDAAGAVRLAKQADALFRERGITRVISTGASLGPSFMAPARARGITCHYIESAARAEGPSLSGKLAARIPGVNLYCQYPAWAGGRWHYSGAIYDGYEPGPVAEGPVRPPSKVVVTFGTNESYGFRRALERLVALLPPEADVLWQVGSTDVSGLGIEARETVPADELMQAVAEADLVVAHSGTGSALTAMDAGKCPVLLPRLARFGEHIDDHQLQIAQELHRRGLGYTCAVEDLTVDVLEAAMARSVRAVPDPPPFLLLRDGAA